MSWKPHATNKNYIMLTNPIDALVRVKPLPDGYQRWMSL